MLFVLFVTFVGFVVQPFASPLLTQFRRQQIAKTQDADQGAAFNDGPV